MGCISWIIFGALAGWMASLIMGRSERTGCLANIFIGIIGSGLGGIIVNVLGAENFEGVTGFNLPSFGVAILGAIILLGVTGWYSNKSRG